MLLGKGTGYAEVNEPTGFHSPPILLGAYEAETGSRQLGHEERGPLPIKRRMDRITARDSGVFMKPHFFLMY